MEGKLIEAVRIRSLLYDTNNPDYMRSKLKTEKWEEIAKEMKMSNGVEAKVLWEKLRHCLRDALRRQQKCIKSGAVAETVKQWKFQKQMGFLLPYMTNRVRDSSINVDSDNSEHQTQNWELGGTADILEEREEEPKIKHENESVEDEVESDALPELPPPSRASKKRRKDNDVASPNRSIAKREDRCKARAEERRKFSEEREVVGSDPLYYFFMSMYQMTKKMPPASQHIVRNNIYRAVSEMEATLLNIPPTYESQHSNVPPYGGDSTPEHSLSYSEISS